MILLLTISYHIVGTLLVAFAGYVGGLRILTSWSPITLSHGELFNNSTIQKFNDRAFILIPIVNVCNFNLDPQRTFKVLFLDDILIFDAVLKVGQFVVAVVV